MFDHGRHRAGVLLCGLALCAGALGSVSQRSADAAAPAKKTVAQATALPAATGAASPLAVPSALGPGSAPKGQPTPYPLNTLAPLGTGTPLPYPVYGTPVPGIVGSPAPGVPAQITLQQAIDVGFARNPALASARADVGVAAAQVRLARAGLLPSFSGSASLSRSHQQPGSSASSRSSGATGSTAQISNFTSDAFSLTLAQLIYDGGKIAASVRAAQRNETAFADTYRRDLQTVAYNVANAYYAYLAAERLVQVDLEIVREDQVQEDLVRAQVRAGTAARADIATAAFPVAQARVAVVRAQGQALSSAATFANAMGLDANARVQPVDDAPVFTTSQVSSIPVPTYDAAIKRALALRPDYDSAVQQVRGSEQSLRAAKLGLFPTLSGNGTASLSSSDPSGGSFRNSQQIGVALSIPIYDQGITSANVAEAQANLDKTNANLQGTTLTVQLSIQQALTNLVTARSAFDQTQAEYTQAVTVLQSTQAQYRAGVTTLPLLLNAQVAITQALTDQVTAVYTLRQAEQSYLYAVGDNYAPPT